MPRIKAAAGRGEARSLAALRVRPCGAERERPGAVWPGPRPPEAWSGGRCARGSTGCCCRSPCSPVGARVARCLYRRGSGLSLIGGVGPRAHGVGVTPSPVTPRCVVSTGEWEPGRGAGGWEGGRNFFPARSRRRSGARGLRAALSFAAAASPGPYGRSPAHPPAVRRVGAAAPRTTRRGERSAPSLENPRVPPSGTRIGPLNFGTGREENLSGSVGLRQHARFNGLLVRGPPRAVPPPGGALPVPAVLAEEVGAG